MDETNLQESQRSRKDLADMRRDLSGAHGKRSAGYRKN